MKTMKPIRWLCAVSLLSAALWGQQAPTNPVPPGEQQAPTNPAPPAEQQPGPEQPPKKTDPRLDQRVTPEAAIGHDQAEMQEDASSAPRADSTPLSGIRRLGTGARPHGGEHDYLVPSFSFTESVDTNPALQGTTPGNEAISVVGGSLDLERGRRAGVLTLHYNGGATFYSKSNALDNHFHELSVQQAFASRVWSLTLGGEANYSPNGMMGLGSFNGSGDTSALGLVSGLAPNDTLLTNQMGRILATGFGQLDLHMTPRNIWTISGSHGVQRFLEADFLDSEQTSLDAGFTHKMRRRNSIGVKYQASFFDLDHAIGGFRRDTAMVSFEHHFAGRYVLQMEAGPERMKVTGGLTPQPASLVPARRASFRFTGKKADWNLGYAHNTLGGGLIVGAEVDSVDGGFLYRFTRSWNAAVTFNYAHNDPVRQLSSLTSALDTLTGGARLERKLGRSMNLYFTYSVSRQNAPTAVCSSGVCADSFLRQVGGIGFSWRPERPIRID